MKFFLLFFLTLPFAAEAAKPSPKCRIDFALLVEQIEARAVQAGLVQREGTSVPNLPWITGKRRTLWMEIIRRENWGKAAEVLANYPNTLSQIQRWTFALLVTHHLLSRMNYEEPPANHALYESARQLILEEEADEFREFLRRQTLSFE